MTVPTARAASPAATSRVSSGSALALLAAVLVVGALVAVGVGGLLPESDIGFRRGRAAVSDRVAPAAPASLTDLDGVPVAAPFDTPAPSLPALASGAFRPVAGSWRVGEQGAEALPSGRASPMAVVEVPATTDTVEVTVAVVGPGAGVVAAWTDPDHYLALVVDPSGRNLDLVRAEGGRPDVVFRAPVEAPGRPLVLALRLVEGRVEAIANGVVLGQRPVQDPGRPWSGGMVAGPGRAGEAVRFRDLVFG